MYNRIRSKLLCSGRISTSNSRRFTFCEFSYKVESLDARSRKDRDKEMVWWKEEREMWAMNVTNMTNSTPYEEDDARWCYYRGRVEVCVR